jgi:hypothetical protein
MNEATGENAEGSRAAAAAAKYPSVWAWRRKVTSTWGREPATSSALKES